MKAFGAPLMVAALTGCALPGACAGRDMAAAVALNRQWAELVFSDTPAAPTDTLTIAHEDAAGDTKVGRCAFGGPLRLGDRVYTRGIGVNSHSVLHVSLTRPVVRLKAVIGLDRNVDHTAASVRFRAKADVKELFATDVMRAGAAPRELDLPLAGARALDLIVDDGGDGRGWDQGDWADARVCFDDGSELWLDDLARRATYAVALPCSFVYGGRHSSQFLATWQRSTSDEVLLDGTLRKTVTLTDPATKLQVRAVCTIYTDTPGADWTVHFTNTGEANTPVLEQVQALDSTLAPGIGSAVVLHRLKGSLCAADDWQPFDQALPPGQKIEMSTSSGRSSSISPFYTVDWGGGGVITALGWSGQWTATVDLQEGKLRQRAGMQNVHLILRPGESFRSPRIMQLFWSGGDVERAQNHFRQTMLSHILPKVDGKPAPPPLAHLSTSFYEMNASNEENVLAHLHAAQGLGFEVFWLDAYWTGPNGFPESMGNYGLPVESVEPKERFPQGLAGIGKAVRGSGLQFLMWFEPERVARGTRLAREHPEWVISPAGDGSGLFNLGLPAAREYMTAYLNAAIREYGLVWLRIDFNIDPLGYWQHADKQDPSRQGMTEIRYVEGLYRLWDDLLAANPGLRIDNCASGGRRIDLETCARSLPLWRSDNTCDMVGADAGTILNAAVKNQVMSAGLNRYLPYSMVGQMGADPYRFRSGFNGGIAFAEDVRPTDYPRDLLRQGLAEAERLRPFWLGDFYALSEVTVEPRDWCVMQYHRPDAGDGIVLGFRRHGSPYSAYRCSLRGIVPEARYRVTTSHSYKPERAVTMRGEDLQRLNLTIGDCPGSVLVEYTLPARK